MALVLQDAGAVAILNTYFGYGAKESSFGVFLYTTTIASSDPAVTTNHTMGSTAATFNSTFGNSAAANATGIVQAVDRTAAPTFGGCKACVRGTALSTDYYTNPALGYTTHGVTGIWSVPNITAVTTTGTINSTAVAGIATAIWADQTFFFTGFLATGSGNQTGTTPGVAILGYGILKGSSLTWGATEKTGLTVADGGLVWYENFGTGNTFTPQNDGDNMTLGLRFRLGNVASVANIL
jgi:hypothetical protein